MPKKNKSPATFRGWCRRCKEGPLPLIMGICARCQKLARENVRMVMHGLTLREARTISDQVKTERFYSHPISSGEVMKTNPILEGWRHSFKTKKEE